MTDKPLDLDALERAYRSAINTDPNVLPLIAELRAAQAELRKTHMESIYDFGDLQRACERATVAEAERDALRAKVQVARDLCEAAELYNRCFAATRERRDLSPFSFNDNDGASAEYCTLDATYILAILDGERGEAMSYCSTHGYSYVGSTIPGCPMCAQQVYMALNLCQHGCSFGTCPTCNVSRLEQRLAQIDERLRILEATALRDSLDESNRPVGLRNDVVLTADAAAALSDMLVSPPTQAIPDRDLPEATGGDEVRP